MTKISEHLTNPHPVVVGTGGILASAVLDSSAVTQEIPVDDLVKILVQIAIGVATIVKMFKNNKNKKQKQDGSV